MTVVTDAPPLPDTVAEVDRSDNDLARAASCGDERAFRELERRHGSRLRAVCRRVTGNDHDALDAYQEALCAAWRALPRFDRRSRVSTWMYRIAVNEAIDARARSQRAPLPVEFLPDTPDPRSGHQQVLDRMVLTQALAALDPVFRGPVVLRHVADLTYDDVAERLDICVGTVKSRLSRGRRSLRSTVDSAPGGNPAAPAGVGAVRTCAVRPGTEAL